MTTSTPILDPRPAPLRLWPAALLLVLLWGCKFLPAVLAGREQVDDYLAAVFFLVFLGPAACALLILGWWLFASRASRAEKWLGLGALLAIIAVTALLADKEVLLGGPGFMFFAVASGMSAFTGALLLFGWWRSSWRTALALLAAAAGFGYWDLVVPDIYGEFRAEYRWRWELSPEDANAARRAHRPTPPPQEHISAAELQTAQWPEFRGPHRNNQVPGVILATDWRATPPKLLWKRDDIGQGWSSFCVVGKRLFTLEQYGTQEAVVSYHTDTGEPHKLHSYDARFYEPIGKAGPRSTPTFSQGKLYTLGATGVLLQLDPVTGAVGWRRELQTDAACKPPTWGFASSPLVLGEQVLVHAGDEHGTGLLLSYEAATGKPRWRSSVGDHSYSSPHLATIAGKTVVLLITSKGLTAHEPADGKIAWQFDWTAKMYRVVQPLVLGDSVLVGTGIGDGTKRVDIKADGAAYKASEGWYSKRMNPYYNDYVAHKGYLYGIDYSIFACIDLATGERQWKEGRYGNGQVLLLPNADQLLVLSEEGELVLLRANPQQHEELTRFQVLTGKTWNHPVLVGDRLYVRNGQEAACYQLPLGRAAP